MFHLPLSTQVWGLIDCDSFYASCELFYDPSLAGKAVCIGKDIVIAASYEAKAYGIKVGTPIREAKKILPSSAVYLPPRMHKYGEVSERLMSFVTSKANQIEIFSIDECFFEIGGYDTLYNISYEDIAERMKHMIQRHIGISVSLGLAPTRLLGKMFAELRKPFGHTVCLDPEKVAILLQYIPLADIPFIGRQTQKKISHLCKTAYDFSTLDLTYVRKTLGVNGVRIWLELNCINAQSFGKKEQPQSISRTRSFNPYFTKEKDKVRAYLMENVEKAIEHLHDVGMGVRRIVILFRTKSFKRFAYEKNINKTLSDSREIVKYVRELFQEIPFEREIIFRTTGVVFCDLEDSRVVQKSIFDIPLEDQEKKTDEKNKKLTETLSYLNKKYGRGIVQIGSHRTKKTVKQSFISLTVQ